MFLHFAAPVTAQAQPCPQTSDGSTTAAGTILGAISDALDAIGREARFQWDDFVNGDYFFSPAEAQRQAQAAKKAKGCEAQIKGKELTRDEKAAVYEALTKIARMRACSDSNGLKKIGRVNRFYKKNAAGKCVPAETMAMFFYATEVLILTDIAGSPQGVAKTQAEELRLTIVHELAHGLFKYRDPRTCKTYSSFLNNPLMRGYMAAVGWIDSATLVEKPGNKPPTEYAKTSPSEDIAESYSYYIYFPEYLKKVSPARYDFFERLHKGTNMDGLSKSSPGKPAVSNSSSATAPGGAGR